MSLRYVLFDLSLFENEEDRENSQKRILCLLEALTNCDQIYLREHPETPRIYDAGITYKIPQQFSEDDVSEIGVLRKFLDANKASASTFAALDKLQKIVGGECFREIPRIIENGGGDCDNLASWRCAELREHGIAAKPYITWRRRQDGGMTYHVVVVYPDGTHEDPCLLLNMGGPERDADRQREREKLAERTAEFIKGLTATRTVAGAIDSMLAANINSSDTIFGVITPQPFTGLQYTIPFQTDDSYENWSPTRPAAFYYDPRYPGGNIQNTPYFNTRMRDADDVEMDFDDRMDGCDDEVLGEDLANYGDFGDYGQSYQVRQQEEKYLLDDNLEGDGDDDDDVLGNRVFDAAKRLARRALDLMPPRRSSTDRLRSRIYKANE